MFPVSLKVTTKQKPNVNRRAKNQSIPTIDNYQITKEDSKKGKNEGTTKKSQKQLTR